MKLSTFLLSVAPLIVMVDEPTVIYTPSGDRISIPAGSEIDACAGAASAVLRYEIEPMIVHVVKPCTERPLFADGFE